MAANRRLSDTSRLTDSIREAFTSDLVVSNRVILLYGVSGIILIFAAEFVRNGQSDLGSALTLSALSTAVSVALAFATRWVVKLVWRRTRRSGIVTAWLMSVGAARGWVMSGVVTAWGLPELAQVTERVIGSATSLPLVYGINAVVLHGVVSHRERVDSLQRTLAQLSERREQALRTLVTFRDDLSERTITAISPVVERIRRMLALNSPETRAAILIELSSLVDTVVRPLSHSLAEIRPDELPPTRTYLRSAKPVWTATPLWNAIEPAWTAILVFGVLTPASMEFFGAWPGFTITLLFAGCLVFVLELTRTLLGSFALRPIPLAIISVVAHEVAAVLFFVSLEVLGRPITDYPVSIVIAVIAMPFVAVAFTSHAVFTVRREQIEQSFRDSRRELEHIVSVYRRTTWLEQRRRAHHLHSTVQSRLHAEIRFLAAREGELNDREAERVHETLAGLEQSGYSAPQNPVDCLAELARLRDFWAGLCAITLVADTEAHALVSANAEANEAVLIVGTEAITNAIRHGAATEVRIEITATENDVVRVTVTNNGDRPSDESVSGLGMKTYDELTMSWNLTCENDLVVGTFDISTRADAGDSADIRE
ncbi:signal transduction histidine kinase [Microbacteriaceae bacterium MWH-Ta3]|nr:signal transduction histidine kinase [Microbacteriaceae bacterium MWH-Ta3]